MNDNLLYPRLHPFANGTAYAFLNKTVMFACTPSFAKNTAEFKWEINNYESREFNLTYLLAHEFMHNVQYEFDNKYYINTTFGKQNWKLEGHADYIARGFKDDGKLKLKIDKFLIEENKDHVGIPVFKLDDGTIQNLTYFKYALMIQYLIEEKGLSFGQVCKLESGLDQVYAEMIDWYKNEKAVEN